METPSIIQICSFSSEEPGAFIAAMRALGQGVRDAGLRHVLVFPEPARSHGWADELKKEGTVHFVPAREPAERWAGQIARIVYRERGLLVNAHYTKYDVPSWLARAMLGLMTRARVQVIWSVRSTPAAGLPALKTVRRQIKFRLLGRTVHLLAVSEGARRRCVELGFPAGRSYTVPNGIDVEATTQHTRSRKAMRTRYGLPPHALVLLGFGGDPHRKGVDVMMDAVRQLVSQHEQEVHLVVAGGADLKQFVTQRVGTGEPDWLHLVPTRECVADYYGMADVFVSASRREGFSFAVAESLASQLPVAISDIVSLKWAKRAPGARFFPNEDAAALAQVVREIATCSEEEQKQRGAASRTFIEENHSLNVWVRRVLDVYAQVQPALRSFLALEGTNAPEPEPLPVRSE